MPSAAVNRKRLEPARRINQWVVLTLNNALINIDRFCDHICR